MLKKISLFLIILLCGLSLTGCTSTLEVIDPLSEEEIIKYVKNRIATECQDDVEVKIISRKKLKVCPESYVPCFYDRKVKGGTSYSIKITNKNNKDISAIVNYNDGYFDTKLSETTEAYLGTKYFRKSSLYKLEKEFNDILSKNADKYFVLRDAKNGNGFQIFINSNDSEKVNNIIENFKNAVSSYINEKHDLHVITYTLYVYKDKDIFDSINFNIYNNYRLDEDELFKGANHSNSREVLNQVSGVTIDIISAASDFNKEMFETDGKSHLKEEFKNKYNDYKYFVYSYYIGQSSTYNTGVSTYLGIN